MTVTRFEIRDAEAIRAALRCARPNCSCQRPRGRPHCPAHDDEHPSLSVDERDGMLLVHCFSGCTQDAVIEALRARGLWDGRPPAPGLSRLVRRRDGGASLEGPLVDVLRFVKRYVVLSSDDAAIAAALWVAHGWVVDAFDITPYLILKSAAKRASQSHTHEVLVWT